MPERQPSPLDRFLRLFTDVRAGEGATALMLALNVFLILQAYYVMKALRTPLILTSGVELSGAELQSYAAAGQALLLLVLVPAYGVLANRFPRRRLINVVTAFFVVCLGLFYLFARLKLPIGVAFYVWVGIFNMMVVAQFWAFANDVYTTNEGKRLFPLVAFGASLGAVAGSAVAFALIKPIGLFQLLPVAAAILAAATLLTNAIDARERRRTEAALPDPMTSGTLPAATGQYRALSGEFKAAGEAYRKESGHFGVIRPGAAAPPAQQARHGTFALVFRSRYLLLIAMLVLLLSWVNSTGEYILSDTLERAADDAVATGRTGGLSAADWIGRWSAAYQGTGGVLAMLLNLFVVGRVLKWFGVRTAILVLPCIALAGYSLLAFAPILAVMRWVKTAENATDYSINNTTRNVLFLPTTREEKYKGKQVIDAFFVRMGDVLMAVLVLFGTHVVLLRTEQFAMINLLLVVVWLVVAVILGRRYERLAAATAT